MGRWNKDIDEKAVKRIWRLKKEEGLSWACIEKRFNISSWIVRRIQHGWTGNKNNA